MIIANLALRASLALDLPSHIQRALVENGECGVWKMRSMKMRSMENEECGK